MLFVGFAARAGFDLIQHSIALSFPGFMFSVGLLHVTFQFVAISFVFAFNPIGDALDIVARMFALS